MDSGRASRYPVGHHPQMRGGLISSGWFCRRVHSVTSVREPDRERARLITNLRWTSSPSPRLRGEGWGEGDWRQPRIRGEPPHPDRKNDTFITSADKIGRAHV